MAKIGSEQYKEKVEFVKLWARNRNKECRVKSEEKKKTVEKEVRGVPEMITFQKFL